MSVALMLALRKIIYMKGMNNMIYADKHMNIAYLDGLSDALGMLARVPESPELYKVKEQIREIIDKESED
jgi:hypothetical protein